MAQGEASTDAGADFGSYDYVIVGAGSAGCLLANRLSADPATRVLLLEAGGMDDWIWFHVPAGYLFAIGNPRADWMFETVAEAGLGGRRLAYSRGKVIGGSSSINAMIYMRGQAADYDGWRGLGLPGWGWDAVLPYFLAHEDHIAADGEFHRAGGEWRVEHPRVRWDILDAIRAAGAAAGIAPIDDFNRGDNAGSSYYQVNQHTGRRVSAAGAFLKPVLKRPNLRLLTGVEVERVVLAGKRATGLTFRRGNKRWHVRASGEIILAAGAIGSPKLLQLSGIGDPSALATAGIPVQHALPGVGANLQDHLQIRPVYQVSGVRTLNTDYANLFRRAAMGLDYVLRRRGPLTMAPSQLGMFAKSSGHHATANLQFHFQPLSLDKWGDGMHRFGAFTASVCNLRPTSRGSVHPAGPDPQVAPLIAPGYLATDEDQQVAIESLRLTRRIVSQAPLARFNTVEFRPGAAAETDEELLAAAAALGTTIFHPVGTAAMGPATDRQAVLDARLRVRGIEGLRVVDASAMPLIVSGNTNSPTLMIAEKGAAMILEGRAADLNQSASRRPRSPPVPDGMCGQARPSPSTATGGRPGRYASGGELVHRVVGPAGLQGRLAGKVTLVIVADVAARHVLVLHTGDAFADLLALDALHIAEHPGIAEILTGEIVRAQCRRVVGRQGDEMVEDAGTRGRVALEGADPLVRLVRQLGAIIIDAHQLRPVIG